MSKEQLPDIPIGDGLSIRPDGVRAPDGRVLCWPDLRKVLLALPQVANKRLGWFRIEGPPSKCMEAADELEEIVNELFPGSDPMRR